MLESLYPCRDDLLYNIKTEALGGNKCENENNIADIIETVL